MGYIDRNLSRNERILKRAFVSDWFVWFRPIRYLVYSILAGYVLSHFTTPHHHPLEIMIWTIIDGIVLICIPVLIRGLIIKATTEVSLTNQRVILKQGVLSQHTLMADLDRIECVNVVQSFIERLFGYGSIAVIAGGQPAVYCRYIGNPHEFQRAVMDQIRRYRTPVPPLLPPVVQPQPRFELN